METLVRPAPNDFTDTGLPRSRTCLPCAAPLNRAHTGGVGSLWLAWLSTYRARGLARWACRCYPTRPPKQLRTCTSYKSLQEAPSLETPCSRALIHWFASAAQAGDIVRSFTDYRLRHCIGRQVKRKTLKRAAVPFIHVSTRGCSRWYALSSRLMPCVPVPACRVQPSAYSSTRAECFTWPGRSRRLGPGLRVGEPAALHAAQHRYLCCGLRNLVRATSPTALGLGVTQTPGVARCLPRLRRVGSAVCATSHSLFTCRRCNLAQIASRLHLTS